MSTRFRCSAAFVGILLLALPVGGSRPSKTEELAALGRLWGVVKFFHPYLAYRGDIDWDRALVEAIPKVREATTKEAYREAVEHMLSFLGDPATRIEGTDEPPDAAEKPETHPADADAEPTPRVERTDDGLAIVVSGDVAAFADSTKVGEFARCVTEASEAEAVVFDLRGSPGAPPDATASAYGAYFFERAARSALPLLLDREVVLPTVRTRRHSGYTPQSGSTSGGYSSGFLVQEAEVVEPRGERTVPTVFLVDDDAPPILPYLVGLQAAGAARLVFEGEPDEHRLSRTGLASYAMELPHGLVAIVRTGEWIRPDGRSGFAPDRVVPPSDDPSRALDVAVELARDGATAEAPAGGVAAAPAARVLRDEPYDDMRYPSPEYRLLALFRLWNVIDLFFPYKHLLDAPWGEALEEFVPRFLEAADELAYAKAVAALAARIQDTHAFVSSTVLSEYVGTHVPPIEVRGIEGESVVTAILDDSLREGNGLRVGDVVREIDGEPVERRRERLAPLFAHSTPQALRYRMHSQLLAGPEGTDVRLLVEGEDAHSREVTAARSVRYVQVFRDTPVFGVLPQGYGYMDLARLMPAQVDEAFEAIRETPAVIFDIRGYPRGTAWQIAPRLTDRKVATAQFRRPEPGDPEPSVEQTLRFDQFTEPAPGKWRYTGKVVALIDERAISQSEHTCLFLEAATDGGVVFVGSATNGANGDVTNVVLPGGIRVSFSGHDVRHADGRQLQRLGIQPHVEAVPTIAGTREGRDEVLERAVRYLREEAGL